MTADAGQHSHVDAASSSDAHGDAHVSVDAPRVSRAFVTDLVLNGDLATAGSGTGDDPGAAGADNLCAAQATKYSLGGQWVAWISTSHADAADRLSAGPWNLVDNTTLVASSLDDLLANGPAHAIDMFPDGTTEVLGDYVWTGSTHGGRLGGGADCSDWTSSADGGTDAGIGGSGNDLTSGPGILWTANGDQACSTIGVLYCFEN